MWHVTSIPLPNQIRKPTQNKILPQGHMHVPKKTWLTTAAWQDDTTDDTSPPGEFPCVDLTCWSQRALTGLWILPRALPKGFLTLKSLVQEFFNSQGIQAHIQTAHLQGFYHC